MALKTPVTLALYQGSRDFLGCVRIEYQGVQAGDTFEPMSLARYSDRTVQVTGTYSGATISIQGTCKDKTNYSVLTAADGLDLNFTSGSRNKFITEATAWTTPVISGGDVNTLVDITFICRGQVA